MNRKISDFQNLGTIHNRAMVADTSLIDEEKRMIPFVLVSNDNGGLRYDFWEDEVYEEVIDVNGARFDNLNTFFKDHRMSVDTAIGKIVNKRLEDNQIKADVIFGTDSESDVIFNKFREGILTDVSIGYTIDEVKVTERGDEPMEVLVTKSNIHELSAVWKGFDTKAKIGRESNKEEVKPNEENDKLRSKLLKKLRLAEAL